MRTVRRGPVEEQSSSAFRQAAEGAVVPAGQLSVALSGAGAVSALVSRCIC
ncbi:hypothetical protein [Salinifilum ghardaiensis]